MSSIIPNTEVFRQEQQRAQQGCQECYGIVSELTKAHYRLLQSYEELVKTIEGKLIAPKDHVLELTKDQELKGD